jgi:transposase
LIFEEGTQSAWLYETLARHVDEIVVTGVGRSRGPKDDRRDAYGLAEKLRIGAVDKPVFKAPAKFTKLRELARIHEMLVADVVRVQSRIKFMYRSRAVATSGKAVYSVAHREEWKARLPAAARSAIAKLYEHYDFLLELEKEAEKELVEESHTHRIARILETAPGVGPIRVARLLPIVVTPHRFRTRRQFWSYCGLGIVMRSNSDWVRNDAGQWQRAQVAQTRGLSKHHNHTLKALFKGAATTVIQQGRRVAIYADYERLLESGTKPNLAKVTLARKIAAIVLRMWAAG